MKNVSKIFIISLLFINTTVRPMQHLKRNAARATLAIQKRYPHGGTITTKETPIDYQTHNEFINMNLDELNLEIKKLLQQFQKLNNEFEQHFTNDNIPENLLGGQNYLTYSSTLRTNNSLKKSIKNYYYNNEKKPQQMTKEEEALKEYTSHIDLILATGSDLKKAMRAKLNLFQLQKKVRNSSS